MSDINKDKVVAPPATDKAKTEATPATDKDTTKEKGSCGSCS